MATPVLVVDCIQEELEGRALRALTCSLLPRPKLASSKGPHDEASAAAAAAEASVAGAVVGGASVCAWRGGWVAAVCVRDRVRVYASPAPPLPGGVATSQRLWEAVAFPAADVDDPLYDGGGDDNGSRASDGPGLSGSCDGGPRVQPTVCALGADWSDQAAPMLRLVVGSADGRVQCFDALTGDCIGVPRLVGAGGDTVAASAGDGDGAALAVKGLTPAGTAQVDPASAAAADDGGMCGGAACAVTHLAFCPAARPPVAETRGGLGGLGPPPRAWAALLLAARADGALELVGFGAHESGQPAAGFHLTPTGGARPGPAPLSALSAELCAKLAPRTLALLARPRARRPLRCAGWAPDGNLLALAGEADEVPRRCAWVIGGEKLRSLSTL
jgi:hypothetical protein